MKAVEGGKDFVQFADILCETDSGVAPGASKLTWSKISSPCHGVGLCSWQRPIVDYRSLRTLPVKQALALKVQCPAFWEEK